ncbi:RNA polymerase sigma factor [Salinispirillum marinum]|uniref:RNA polymerase sigma factor n=2 Tax=Saccharospirillaceae TaxID=255527 RepID=A0ABV8BDI0_9GAMM
MLFVDTYGFNETTGVVKDSTEQTDIAALAYWLPRIALGDQEALKRVYELTSARLMSIAMRILGDEADSADVLQTLYLKLWQRALPYVDTGNAWAWLCVVTRNAALDQRKHQLRRREDMTDDMSTLLDAEVDLQDENFVHEDAMQRCLGALSQERRQVIEWSYLYGYSHGELAERTGKPLGTVKAWIRRGLGELKLCLQS